MAKKKTSKSSPAAEESPALLLRDCIPETTLKEYDRSFLWWLEKLVERYRELYAEAEEQGHDPSSQGIPCGVGVFVSAIGIDLRGKPWTGSLISGTWYHCWMNMGAECEVRAKAQGIFAQLQALVDDELTDRST